MKTCILALQYCASTLSKCPFLSFPLGVLPFPDLVLEEASRFRGDTLLRCWSLACRREADNRAALRRFSWAETLRNNPGRHLTPFC